MACSHMCHSTLSILSPPLPCPSSSPQHEILFSMKKGDPAHLVQHGQSIERGQMPQPTHRIVVARVEGGWRLLVWEVLVKGLRLWFKMNYNPGDLVYRNSDVLEICYDIRS